MPAQLLFKDVDSTATSPRGDEEDSSLITDAGVSHDDGGRCGLKAVAECNGVIAMFTSLPIAGKADLIIEFSDVFSRFGGCAAAFEK